MCRKNELSRSRVTVQGANASCRNSILDSQQLGRLAGLLSFLSRRGHFKTGFCLDELARRASEGWAFDDGDALACASG